MSLPFFPMYPTDFEAKTSHLTLEEDGAYNRLLRLCWMSPNCSVPDDDAWIMRRLRCDEATYVRVVKVVIEEFFTRKNGYVFSKRLSKEWVIANEAHKKRKNAGKKGGNSKALKTKENRSSNAVAMLKQCSSNQNQNQNQNHEDIGGSSAREILEFREQILEAMGHDRTGLTATGKIICNPEQMLEVKRWLGDLNLSEQDILGVIKSTPCNNGPPSTPKYYTRAMQRFADEKSKPKLSPISGGRNDRNDNHARFQRIIEAAAEGTSGQDWG